MFTDSAFNGDLSDWKPYYIDDMENMFLNCKVKFHIGFIMKVLKIEEVLLIIIGKINKNGSNAVFYFVNK
jgi:hypothetical protein